MRPRPDDPNQSLSFSSAKSRSLRGVVRDVLDEMRETKSGADWLKTVVEAMNCPKDESVCAIGRLRQLTRGIKNQEYGSWLVRDPDRRWSFATEDSFTARMGEDAFLSRRRAMVLNWTPFDCAGDHIWGIGMTRCMEVKFAV
jgi:hypothetical protein